MNYKIIGKYIKEINFNIPNPKTFFLLSKEIKNYKINIDIKSNQVKKNIIEVLTSLNLNPIKSSDDSINTKIIFSTVIELSENNIEKNEIEKIILIKVPSQIYKELRKIFVSLFEYSGFKDIKINENVDFEKLYNMRKIQ
tara:strand:- start:187 stop:606 length:420 start_codon:yes stop_codon:yes gene_type:complete